MATAHGGRSLSRRVVNKETLKPAGRPVRHPAPKRGGPGLDVSHFFWGVFGLTETIGELFGWIFTALPHRNWLSRTHCAGLENLVI